MHRLQTYKEKGNDINFQDNNDTFQYQCLGRIGGNSFTHEILMSLHKLELTYKISNFISLSWSKV